MTMVAAVVLLGDLHAGIAPADAAALAGGVTGLSMAIGSAACTSRLVVAAPARVRLERCRRHHLVHDRVFGAVCALYRVHDLVRGGARRSAARGRRSIRTSSRSSRWPRPSSFSASRSVCARSPGRRRAHRRRADAGQAVTPNPVMSAYGSGSRSGIETRQLRQPQNRILDPAPRIPYLDHRPARINKPVKSHYYSQHAVALRAELGEAISRDQMRELHQKSAVPALRRRSCGSSRFWRSRPGGSSVSRIR